MIVGTGFLKIVKCLLNNVLRDLMTKSIFCLLIFMSFDSRPLSFLGFARMKMLIHCYVLTFNCFKISFYAILIGMSL